MNICNSKKWCFVYLISIKEIIDKNKNKMAFIRLYDTSGIYEFTVFNRVWNGLSRTPIVGDLIRISINNKDQSIINTMRFVDVAVDNGKIVVCVR